MSFKPDDRVLVKPLGVKGTVLRLISSRRPGPRNVVQPDSGGPPQPWYDSELEKLEVVPLQDMDLATGRSPLDDFTDGW